VRMADKLSRLGSVIGSLSATEETVQDTLDDLANYAILLSAYIEAKKPLPPEVTLQLYPEGAAARVVSEQDTRVSDHTELWEARCP
jgi:hypothetical protein